MSKFKNWIDNNQWKIFGFFCLLFLVLGDYVISLISCTFALMNYPWKKK